MIAFASNFALLSLLFRLLTLSGTEGLHQEQKYILTREWRRQALSSPRCSYRKINYLQKSIELEPDASGYLELGETYYDLAIAYGHQDLFQEAIQAYGRALALKPELVEAHYRLGTIYFLLRDFDRCRQELLAARALNPEHQPVQNSLRLLEEIAWP